MNAPPTPVRARLLSVDALRAIAALAVLIYHVPRTAAGWSSEAQFLLSLPVRFGAGSEPVPRIACEDTPTGLSGTSAPRRGRRPPRPPP